MAGYKLYRAFIDDDDDNEKYRLTYYHNPQRWKDNFINDKNPIKDINNWSNEIKYLDPTNTTYSNEINLLPTDVGGIYLFYVKGLNLPFFENYILYVGRCQYTKGQNINKRAKEYLTDKRVEIRRMFRKWKDVLYYRYYPDKNNQEICEYEVKLIRSITPEYNDQIPDKIEIQEPIPAFQ